MNTEVDNNLAYQEAPSGSGGSYTARKLEKLRLPPLSGKRFLDLGCNMGFYCNLAAKAGAAHVVGVDMDKKVIQEASRLYPTVQFFDTGWDVFPEGQFDIIVCLSAIHYARDPIALAEEIRSHLSADGVFILEGGLVDPRGKFSTDLLIPGWRMVGDRCRHLSGGFVTNHMLREFSWEIVGPSEQRGGDNVLRQVIHARPGERRRESDTYFLDLIQYASGLAESADTIVSTMPSADYVRQLGAVDRITRKTLENVFSVEENKRAFLDDLVFAIGARHPIQLKLAKSVGNTVLEQVTTHLRHLGAISASETVRK